MALSDINSLLFRRVCSRFATGITILTVLDESGTPHGLTVNSFTSVSCEPPLVLVCVDHRCSLLPCFRRAAHYGINMLGEEQEALSVRFAKRSSNSFEDLSWEKSPCGAPLLTDALAALECRTTRILDAGDHAILIAEVTRARYREGQPLVYFGSSYRRLS
jgi:Conserved protein/domain typically associated with flavoprotein oxygenases, DIM6/NTAB family